MSSTVPKDRRWWLLENQTPQGPFNIAFVQLRLNSGALSRDTPACPEGGDQWRPLFHWPEFAPEAPPPYLVPPPLPPPVLSASKPRSPCPNLLGFEAAAVLQAIDVYVFYISPSLFLASGFMCVASPPTFHPQSPYFGLEFLSSLASLAGEILVVALLIAAGLELRKQKQYGMRLLFIGFAINAFLTCGSILFYLCLSAAATADTQVNHFYPEEATPAATLLALGMLMVYLAAATFHIAVWIWAAANFRDLPLEE